MVRPRFDRRTALERDYTATRGFTYNGRQYEAGETFDKSGLTAAQLQTLYGARALDFAPADAPAAQSDRPDPSDQIRLAQTGGGYFEISAPWLDKPVRIRGKAKAEERLAEIRDEGPPLGFIEGGSPVSIDEQGGGWYAVSAPWLDEPEKLQGREAAEARQRELHAEGEPEHHHGVAVLQRENGWYEVRADWDGEGENVRGEEAARARAAELREAGPPPAPEPNGEVQVIPSPDHPGMFHVVIPWEDKMEQFTGENARDDAMRRAEELRQQDPRLKTVDGPAASVLITVDGDKHVVSAPWLDEPETFDTPEDADARQRELRDAGPPQGWEPAAPDEQSSEGEKQ